MATHNTFLDCRVHFYAFFRQPFSKQLYTAEPLETKHIEPRGWSGPRQKKAGFNDGAGRNDDLSTAAPLKADTFILMLFMRPHVVTQAAQA